MLLCLIDFDDQPLAWKWTAGHNYIPGAFLPRQVREVQFNV